MVDRRRTQIAAASSAGMNSPNNRVRPPNDPWRELNNGGSSAGCLSVYLSDSLSALPVRGVALAANNKSDPNIETATYGLFSTCSRDMRASAVRRGLTYVFFITRWKSERVITGFYRLSWYAPGTLHGPVADYCLAASEQRFVFPPVRMPDLPKAVRAEVSRPFRLFKLLRDDHSEVLYRELTSRPDATAKYLQEIDRLERFNLFRSGYRYVAWKQKEPFDWSRAVLYLKSSQSRHSGQRPPKNSTPTNQWRCTKCRNETVNKALLKICPHCGAPGSLEPR